MSDPKPAPDRTQEARIEAASVLLAEAAELQRDVVKLTKAAGELLEDVWP